MCSLPGWRNTRTQASCTTSSASLGFLKNRSAKVRPRLRSFGSSRKEIQGLHIPSSDLLTSLVITLYLQVSNFQRLRNWIRTKLMKDLGDLFGYQRTQAGYTTAALPRTTPGSGETKVFCFVK